MKDEDVPPGVGHEPFVLHSSYGLGHKVGSESESKAERLEG
jgi:hypothetical protein